ncbi:hypothetical protein LVJ94_29720 [Pendulispora rubella]|uniref:Uncharacterized protein n=1 Tax=Pendulispora rubella TaxID=2741070 RepID=A0ABZ2KQY2_9BACT
MKSRQSSLAATVEQLQTELVNAVFDALRQSAVAALGTALTPTGRLFNFSEADIARVRPAARQRATPTPARGRRASSTRKSSVSSSQLALPLRDSSPPPAQDTPFTITDPSVLLASVQAETAHPLPPVQKIPSRRGRKPREPRVLQAPQEVAPVEPEVAAPPALRDGEEVAKAVLGGGVVLRRRRT